MTEQNMAWMRFGTWSLTTWLVLIATLPAFIVFAAVSTWLYLADQEEVSRRLAERGRLVAAAVAESSQYGVVSGNVSYLERNIAQLLKTDSAIAEIAVMDAARNVLASARQAPTGGAIAFERAIGGEVLDIDLFGQSGPHLSTESGQALSFKPGRVVGFVRVAMSKQPVVQEQRRRLLLNGLGVLIATLLGGVAGLYLAHRLRAPMRGAMTALLKIEQGNYDIEFGPPRAGEIGALQRALLKVGQALNIKKQEFEEKVASRTLELESAMDRLTAADAERRRLIARTNDILEEERTRIAIEIHDDLNASLIVIKLNAADIVSHASTKEPTPTTLKRIERVAATISETTEDLYAAARNIIKQLRPEVIDALGLPGAARELVRHHDELKSGCKFDLQIDPTFPQLRGPLAMTCYRLIQEALSNVIKHAAAKTAVVQLDRDRNMPVLRLLVSDDGQGFDTAAGSPGRLGLVAMRERVDAAGGSIVIDSTKGGGTRISITLPFTE